MNHPLPISEQIDLQLRELVLLCCITDPDQESVDRVRELVSSEIDWPDFLLITAKNGILPLAAYNLIRFAKTDLPEDIGAAFEGIVTDHAIRNAFLTKTMVSIVEGLREAGIETLPLKGPSLAIEAYRNPALRDYCDLDFVVRERNFDEAVRFFEDDGYSIVEENSFLQRVFSGFSRKKHTVLFKPEGEVLVELHWKLSGAYFSIPFEVERLWKSLESQTVGGTQIPKLPFEDLFVYLCLHGTRHRWAKLGWLVDLLELQKTSGIEPPAWDKITARADHLGCRNVLEFSIYLLNRLFPQFEHFGSDESKNVRNADYQKFSVEIEGEIFSRDQTQLRFDEKYAYFTRLKEKPAHRVKLHLEYVRWYGRMIFKPNSGDKSSIRLPTVLSPFYYMFRPIRLLTGYLKDNSTTQKKVPDYSETDKGN